MEVVFKVDNYPKGPVMSRQWIRITAGCALASCVRLSAFQFFSFSCIGYIADIFGSLGIESSFYTLVCFYLSTQFLFYYFYIFLLAKFFHSIHHLLASHSSFLSSLFIYHSFLRDLFFHPPSEHLIFPLSRSSG